MNKNKITIEKRLEGMKKVYGNIENIVDNIPEAIPKDIRKTIKDKILGDKDLKELMEGIDSHRPPRIFFIGRTGVGKSSLINAMCGAYVADVDDVRSCTSNVTPYKIMDGDRVLMEVLDTRGFAESIELDNKQTAEDALLTQVKAFSPDVALFVLNSTHRDDIIEDIEFLKKVTEEYEKLNKLKLPVVVVVNKCDEVQPGRCKDPNGYPNSKLNSINDIVIYYKGLIVNNNLKIQDIIPVSSYIEWETSDGLEIDARSIKNLPDDDIENLQISFDGRYNIENLYNILDKAILDFEAQMGLRMAFRLNELVKRIAKHCITIFSTISAGVALSPLPLSDIYILLLIQAILVMIIAALSGREVTIDLAKEFMISASGLGGVGIIFRFIGQQAVKLANLLIPGSGSGASALVAAAGTEIVGRAAVGYYIEGKSIEDVKKQIEKDKREKCDNHNI